VTLFGTLRGQVPVNASIESPLVPISSPDVMELFGPGAGASGVAVTEERSIGLSAVWSAVNLLAGTIASLPLHAYRKDGTGREKVPSTHRSAVLLDEPHEDLTAMEFWELVVAHIALWGNGYLRYRFDRLGRVIGFDGIHPGRVKVARHKESRRKYYVIDGNVDRPLTDDDLLHIPGFGYDGICGVSPIRAAREGVGLAMAAEKFGGKMFGSGLLATGVLQTEQRLNEEQAKILQSRWKAKTSGMANAHETVVLDSGAKFTQLSIPPEDAQFLESRKFQVTEIARMFRIPPHMIGDVEKSTSWGTGIEQMGIGFVVYTLRGYTTRIEQRITRVISPNAVYARFNFEGLLRGDSAARAAFYNQMWTLGAYSTNEIRALEELPPIEGGEVRYRPLNMGELGTTDQPNQQTAGDPNATRPAHPVPIPRQHPARTSEPDPGHRDCGP